MQSPNTSRSRLALCGVRHAGLAALLCLLAATGCRTPPITVSPKELKDFPLDAALPGQPPRSGVRYWHTPFTPLPITGCYVSVGITGKAGAREYELWQNTWGDGGAPDRQIIVHRGPALDQMRSPQTACDGTMITDVPNPKKPDELSTLRGYTRPAMCWDPELGHVLLTCVCPDYMPGSVPLLPAVLVSTTGEPGTFKYLGKLKGDLAAEAAKRNIWSDGGSLIRLKDGRWRLYINGFGTVLSTLECDTLTGDWRFLRAADGAVREFLPDFPKAPNRGGCFPTVLRVAEDNWHLWITDTWPPQSIWHYWSRDGLTWKAYGRQPEITRAAFGGRGIKCLRAYLDPDTHEIVGLLSVWGNIGDSRKEWVLHQSRMPSGPP